MVGRKPRWELRPVRGDTVLRQRFKNVPVIRVLLGGRVQMRLGGGGVFMAVNYLYSNRIWLVLMREINEGSWRCEPLRLSTA